MNRSRLRHRRFGPEAHFSPKSDDFYFAKSEFSYVLIMILMAEMDSKPSKTLGAPNIPKFNNCKLDFENF